MSQAPPQTPDPRASIHAAALALGFDVCGFASAADPWPAGARLERFVAEGRHGTMGWMAQTLARRTHPRAMWCEARSAIVLGMNYGPDHDPRAALLAKDRGVISVYAQGDDYHDLIKGRLKQLGGWMAARFGGDLKVFVDTAPLMEKPLAERAGLGWQGKHTNLVSRGFGSWLFLGAILTTLDLAADAASGGHCGQCRACQDACPTEALDTPWVIDARACLSYLTIEHAGPWPERYRLATGNRIYGCDDCLAACPWNKFASEAREVRLQARDMLKSPALSDLLALDEARFRTLFAKSPVKRIGRDRFLRNVLYAAGNSGEAALIPAVAHLLSDAGALVRGAAVWALSRLESPEAFRSLRTAHLDSESDAGVRFEWSAIRLSG